MVLRETKQWKGGTLTLAPSAITAAFRSELGERVVRTSTFQDQACVTVESSAWVEAFSFAKSAPQLACDFFTFVSAIDWVPEPTAEPEPEPAEPTTEATPEPEPGEDVYFAPQGDLFQVIGRVYSTTGRHGVTIKTDLTRQDATIPTLTTVYAGADWHERELAEMFGIAVEGHPNPAGIYLPDHFEGHPLRKSFVLRAREMKPWPGGVDVKELPENAPVLDGKGNVVDIEAETPDQPEDA